MISIVIQAVCRTHHSIDFTFHVAVSMEGLSIWKLGSEKMWVHLGLSENDVGKFSNLMNDHMILM